MKILILYKSKAGSTKQYATWLHQAFPASNLYSIDDFEEINFNKYDLIVIGGWTMSGQIVVKNYLKQNWNKLKDKIIYLFVVGIFPQNRLLSKIAYNQLADEVKKGLSGYSNLIGNSPSSEPKKLERFMLKSFGANLDKTIKKENLNPIISFINKQLDEE